MYDIGDAILAMIIGIAVIAFGAGLVVMWGLPKLWEFIKPFLHALTA